METKSSNAPVVVIAFTVVIIVAMICGMVIWLMQRSMAMNERLNDRLLEVRLQEAKAAQAQAGHGSTAKPVEAPTASATESALADIQARLKRAEEAAQREADARRKAEQDMAALLSKQQQPAPVVVVQQPAVPTPTPAPKQQIKPQPKKPETPKAAAPKKDTPPKATPAKPHQTQAPKIKPRPAPQEIPAAQQRVGSDGYPLNRVTLPMGNDELDWQL